MKLYKILVDGKSCNGGDLKWSLPKNGNPGKWQKGYGLLCDVNGKFYVYKKI